MATSVKFSFALWALVMLATCSYAAQVSDVIDEFPDIIAHLKEKEQIRFLSKVEWFEKEKTIMGNKLVDEAYFSGGRSGRVIVHDDIPMGQIANLAMSLRSMETREQADIAAVCPSLKEISPMKDGLILPEGCMREILSYTVSGEISAEPIKLYGLSAILAHTTKNLAGDVVKEIPKDNKKEIIFKLDTKLGNTILFNFVKKEVDQKLSISNTLGLIVTIFKRGEQDVEMNLGTKIAQLTVLQIQDQLKVPKETTISEIQGYTCSHCSRKCNSS